MSAQEQNMKRWKLRDAGSEIVDECFMAFLRSSTPNKMELLEIARSKMDTAFDELHNVTLPAVTKALEEIAREIADEINAEETGLDTYPQVLRAMQLALRAGQPDETAKLREEVELERKIAMLDVWQTLLGGLRAVDGVLGKQQDAKAAGRGEWNQGYAAATEDARKQIHSFIEESDGQAFVTEARAQLAAALAAVGDKHETLRDAIAFIELIFWNPNKVGHPEFHATLQVLRDRLAKQPDASALEDYVRAKQFVEWIAKNCKVIYWPNPNAYPIEHAPFAGKLAWELIEAEFSHSQERAAG